VTEIGGWKSWLLWRLGNQGSHIYTDSVASSLGLFHFNTNCDTHHKAPKTTPRLLITPSPWSDRLKIPDHPTTSSSRIEWFKETITPWNSRISERYSPYIRSAPSNSSSRYPSPHSSSRRSSSRRRNQDVSRPPQTGHPSWLQLASFWSSSRCGERWECSAET
jgi:hypothetical protein